MKKSLEITVECIDSDVERAVLYFILHIKKMYVYLVAAVLIVIVSFMYAASQDFNFFGTGQFILIFISGVMFYWLCFTRYIDSYVKIYRRRKYCQYCFGEDEVIITGKEAQSICRWSIFKEAYITPSAVLLLDENKFIYIVPNRCFECAPDMNQMEKLLLDNIKDFHIK